MPGEVDYLQIPIGADYSPTGQLPVGPPPLNDSYSGLIRLPTSSTITVTLQPVYSRKNISENFNLTDYASGFTVRGGNSTRGGFI
jgi:hypothetical protein